MAFPGAKRLGGDELGSGAPHPWMVSLQHRNRHFCGGTLLDERHVLPGRAARVCVLVLLPCPTDTARTGGGKPRRRHLVARRLSVTLRVIRQR